MNFQLKKSILDIFHPYILKIILPLRWMNLSIFCLMNNTPIRSFKSIISREERWISSHLRSSRILRNLRCSHSNRSISSRWHSCSSISHPIHITSINPLRANYKLFHKTKTLQIKRFNIVINRWIKIFLIIRMHYIIILRVHYIKIINPLQLVKFRFNWQCFSLLWESSLIK